MIYKLFAIIGTVLLLASCETAQQKLAVVGSNDMAWSKNRRAVTTID